MSMTCAASPCAGLARPERVLPVRQEATLVEGQPDCECRDSVRRRGCAHPRTHERRRETVFCDRSETPRPLRPGPADDQLGDASRRSFEIRREAGARASANPEREISSSAAHSRSDGGKSCDSGGRMSGPGTWIFTTPRKPGHHISRLHSAHDRVCAKAGLSLCLYDLRAYIRNPHGRGRGRLGDAGSDPGTRFHPHLGALRPSDCGAQARSNAQVCELPNDEGRRTGQREIKLSGPTLDQLWAKMKHIFRYRGQMTANDLMQLNRVESRQLEGRLEARVGIGLLPGIDNT